ncbi:MAG: hypothetical protein JNL12_23420 [Planctomycetes bacterium]|nr:hypothetical protein [Planctomycetota bacterium]
MRHKPFWPFLSCFLLPVALPSQATVLVSQTPAGTAANNSSDFPVVSGDGRFVAFYSAATNLVAGDTNNRGDIFVRDLHAGVTTRVSVGAGGVQADRDCINPVISTDGRFVLFESTATNLGAGGTGSRYYVYLHDRQTGVTSLESLTSGGGVPSGSCTSPSISDDGARIVFRSEAGDIVPNDTNSTWDTFLRDRQLGTTTRISMRADGSQTVAQSQTGRISGDGRYVAFDTADPLEPSDQGFLTDVYVRDLLLGTLERATVNTSGGHAVAGGSSLDFSRDGRFVLITSGSNDLVPNDTNLGLVGDLFVRDLLLDTTELVNWTTTGVQAVGTIWSAKISAEGRRVVFCSSNNTIVPGDTNPLEDVFVRDRWLGSVAKGNLSATGAQANNGTRVAHISADGRYVTFRSSATNLVPGITAANCIYARDIEPAGCGNGGTASTYGGAFATGNPNFGFQLTGANPAAFLVFDLGLASPGIACGSCVMTDPIVLVFATNLGGSAQLAFPVPSNPLFIGPTFEFQWLANDGLASPCPLHPGWSSTARVRFSAVN